MIVVLGAAESAVVALAADVSAVVGAETGAAGSCAQMTVETAIATSAPAATRIGEEIL